MSLARSPYRATEFVSARADFSPIHADLDLPVLGCAARIDSSSVLRRVIVLKTPLGCKGVSYGSSKQR